MLPAGYPRGCPSRFSVHTAVSPANTSLFFFTVQNLVNETLPDTQIFRRLVLLKERVDDTEDLVKIELDSKLSDLFVLEVLVTSTTLAFAAANLVCSFLGMNVHNNVEDSTLAFILVVVLSLSGIVISTAAFVWYLRRRFQFGLPDAPLPQVTTGYYRRRVEEEE